ncbi:Putative transposase (IS66 family element, Orf2-like) [gamma proteobacterium HdN1]|nr:transposase, IS66 family (orf2) [gamma proteobacterium HdN1]CBL45524.1 transposase (IS66 family, Orf2-like) [gamma proteobacterium HdN1]CBL45599.1 Transposase (IS66 family, Orf2-like) [gamma proteobacterium HdN1]CBL46556.1 putative transposase (IS66 family element, orf2-like) [gamma proteobacterium HdN1]CBL46565.1 Transposase (IS66 family element, orf2-like) [gamma proteobacterium HdN1]
MKMFVDPSAIYLHRHPVDFRKSINGLSVIVDEQMAMSSLSGALFVFCNKQRDKLKVLYWDQTGFCLWYKRLEKDRFVWPKRFSGSSIELSERQWQWLLEGFDIEKIKGHQAVNCRAIW